MSDENLIVQTYQVNMVPQSVPGIVHVSQYDAGERILRFILYSGSQKFVIPANAIVTISGGKSDGTIYEYQMTKVDDSTVQIPVQAQMTAVAGWHTAEIVVYDASTITGSCNIKIKVEISPSGSNYIPSVTDNQLLNEAVGAAAEAAIYRDQTKQYESNAERSASAAATSQKTAEGNAQASATNANNSSKSASDAAKSAAAAAASEKNAMSATPEGYEKMANIFNALGIYIDSEGYPCQALDGEKQD